jgi:hypothetical protein
MSMNNRQNIELTLSVAIEKDEIGRAEAGRILRHVASVNDDEDEQLLELNNEMGRRFGCLLYPDGIIDREQ